MGTYLRQGWSNNRLTVNLHGKYPATHILSAGVQSTSRCRATQDHLPIHAAAVHPVDDLHPGPASGPACKYQHQRITRPLIFTTSQDASLTLRFRSPLFPFPFSSNNLILFNAWYNIRAPDSKACKPWGPSNPCVQRDCITTCTATRRHCQALHTMHSACELGPSAGMLMPSATHV